LHTTGKRVYREKKRGDKKGGGVLEYIKSDVIPPKTVKRKVAKKLRGEGLSGEKKLEEEKYLQHKTVPCDWVGEKL